MTPKKLTVKALKSAPLADHTKTYRGRALFVLFTGKKHDSGFQTMRVVMDIGKEPTKREFVLLYPHADVLNFVVPGGSQWPILKQDVSMRGIICYWTDSGNALTVTPLGYSTCEVTVGL